MIFMMMLSLLTSMIFPTLKHPLSMGLTLIIQTIIIAMITGMMTGMFWFSYILLMTILSGALVLFIYMASVASNEKFYTSWKLIILSMILLTLGITMMIFMDQMMTSKIWSMKEGGMMSLSNFFMNYNVTITLFLTCYLLATMIVINFIVSINEGPLRSKN
uniref:NADH dehydrogenase subunit 6 n=1 Tax=Carcinocoris binghami TaxID=1347739 RepID=A0A342CF96_9HEMI|nr:NADH dehydrogenase subunit 6 [Carcinocoris binghami]AGO28049.1 NADH dehydrogenase subunit 6 [Carcinocoris binghami]